MVAGSEHVNNNNNNGGSNGGNAPRREGCSCAFTDAPCTSCFTGNHAEWPCTSIARGVSPSEGGLFPPSSNSAPAYGQREETPEPSFRTLLYQIKTQVDKNYTVLGKIFDLLVVAVAESREENEHESRFHEMNADEEDEATQRLA